jgi:hypothetical protein
LNFNDIHLHRVFNNGAFDKSGRWYGGWWQTIPKEYRPYIRIDEEEASELDYSGCFPRMLYHLEGLQNQDDDRYDIPEIRSAALKQRLDWENVRPSIKKLLNILVNAEQEQGTYRVSGLSLPAGFKDLKKIVYPLLRNKHSAISKYFHSGVSWKLMYYESQICETILMQGMVDGIAVLPIHDSFMVQARHKRWLRQTMDDAYFGVFNFHPVIKEKGDPGMREHGYLRKMGGPIIVSEDSQGMPIYGQQYLDRSGRVTTEWLLEYS